MRHRRLLTEIAFLVLTAFAVAAVLETSGIVRSMMSALLMFVLPGRAFLAGWFPHRLAEAPENILLTIIVSIAITAIGGLLLNLLPSGMEAQTWAIWLSGTATFNEVIVLLRALIAPGETVSGQTVTLRPAQALMMAAAGIILVGGVVVARSGALNQPHPGFTQLWMLPDSASDEAQIGVRNEEGAPVTYGLVVRQGATIIQAYDVQIDTAQTWNTIVPLPLNARSADQPIQAELYRIDQPNTVYRSVTLWLSETGSK